MTTAVSSRSRIFALAATTLVLAVAIGFLIGKAWAEDSDSLGGWHSGTAQVGERVFTVNYDGWSYGASDSVPSWIDERGSWHYSGWPTCLQAKADQSVSLTFEATQATVDGATFRPVVAVDCRG